jgi:hypothetical protein
MRGDNRSAVAWRGRSASAAGTGVAAGSDRVEVSHSLEQKRHRMQSRWPLAAPAQKLLNVHMALRALIDNDRVEVGMNSTIVLLTC